MSTPRRWLRAVLAAAAVQGRRSVRTALVLAVAVIALGGWNGWLNVFPSPQPHENLMSKVNVRVRVSWTPWIPAERPVAKVVAAPSNEALFAQPNGAGPARPTTSTASSRSDARLPLVYLTAASGNHFRWLVNAIRSVNLNEPTVPYIIYDLGFTAGQATWLMTIPTIHLRAFNYSRYPAYFNIRVANGEYAFKPVLIAEMLDEADVVVWMDASDILLSPISKQLDVVHDIGFHSGVSFGEVQQWTHPGMLEYFKIGSDDPIRTRPSCNAAFLIFYREKTLETLIKPWVNCALTRECIAPPGSNRGNHRQDQAALSILVWQSRQFRCQFDDLYKAYTIHQEADHLANEPGTIGVGSPTTWPLMARRMRVVAERIAPFVFGSRNAQSSLDRFEQSLTLASVGQEDASMLGLQIMPKDHVSTALEVLALLFINLPMGKARSIVVVQANALAPARRHLARWQQAWLTQRLLFSLLGSDGSLIGVHVRCDPPANLVNPFDDLVDVDTFAPKLAPMDPAASWTLALMASAKAKLPDGGDAVVYAQHPDEALESFDGLSWPTQPRSTMPGPAFVDVTVTSLDQAAWAYVTSKNLRTQHNVGLYLIVGGPEDGLRPGDHLRSFLSSSPPPLFDGRAVIAAWLTPSGDELPRKNDDVGCAAVWTKADLFDFAGIAGGANMSVVQIGLAPPPSLPATRRSGCLLLAVSKGNGQQPPRDTT